MGRALQMGFGRTSVRAVAVLAVVGTLLVASVGCSSSEEAAPQGPSTEEFVASANALCDRLDGEAEDIALPESAPTAGGGQAYAASELNAYLSASADLLVSGGEEFRNLNAPEANRADLNELADTYGRVGGELQDLADSYTGGVIPETYFTDDLDAWENSVSKDSEKIDELQAKLGFAECGTDSSESTETTTGSSSGSSGAGLDVKPMTMPSDGAGLRDAMLEIAREYATGDTIETALPEAWVQALPDVSGFGSAVPAEKFGEVSGVTGATVFSSGLVGWAFAVYAAPPVNCVIGAVWATESTGGKFPTPSGELRTIDGAPADGAECTGQTAYDYFDSFIK